MTTIAIRREPGRGWVMAADTRITINDSVFTTGMKIRRLSSGAYLGSAGSPDARCMAALLDKATPKRLPSPGKLAATEMEFDGILAFPVGPIFLIAVTHNELGEWTGEIVECIDDFNAAGSGRKFAIGAMAAGATARAAVEIACGNDIYSGLPVIEHELNGKHVPRPS